MIARDDWRDGSIRLLAGRYKFQHILAASQLKTARTQGLELGRIPDEPRRSERTKTSLCGTSDLVVPAVTNEHRCRWVNAQPMDCPQINLWGGLGNALGE
jgi:hypothetical protein